MCFKHIFNAVLILSNHNFINKVNQRMINYLMDHLHPYCGALKLNASIQPFLSVSAAPLWLP